MSDKWDDTQGLIYSYVNVIACMSGTETSYTILRAANSRVLVGRDDKFNVKRTVLHNPIHIEKAYRTGYLISQNSKSLQRYVHRELRSWYCILLVLYNCLHT